MSEQFYTILTKVGKAKIANATALGAKVNFCKFQVGDSNGAYYNPTEEQTELKHKVWQGNINNIRIDDKNPNWVIIEVILPSEIGGFTIREAAMLDDEDNVIAVAKYPETYKPQTKDGSSKDILIRTILEVSNANSVTLKVDPTVILATKKDIEVLEQKIKNIKVPVTSVNTKTGDIILKAEDIECEDGKSVETHLDDMTEQIKGIEVTAEKTKLNNPNFKSNNVNGALNELFQNASNNKQKLVDIITGLGGDANIDMTYDQLYNVFKNLNAIKLYEDDQNYNYKFDPWRYQLNSKTRRNNARSIVYKDKIYIVGGVSGATYYSNVNKSYSSIEVLNVKTAKSELIETNFKGELGSLYIYNDKLYHIGGCYDIDSTKSKGFESKNKCNIEVFDLKTNSNSWVELGKWDDYFDNYNFAFGYKHTLYFAKNSQNVYRGNVTFNLLTNTWTSIDDFAYGIYSYDCYTINNKNYSSRNGRMNIYNIDTNTLTSTSKEISSSAFAPGRSCVYENKIYYIDDSLFIYDTVTETSTKYASVPILNDFNTVACSNNKFFLINGSNDRYNGPTSAIDVCVII